MAVPAVARVADHPAQHLLRNVQRPAVRDEEEPGLGDRPVGKAVPDDLELRSGFLDHDPAGVGRGGLRAVGELSAVALNLKAAKQIGLMIPPNVLVRADKVIKRFWI